MAEFPFLPLLVVEYLADTQHLTQSQHGAYLLLIISIWRSPECRIKNAVNALRGRCSKSTAMFLVENFFHENTGGWLTPYDGIAERHADWSIHPCRWDRHDWKRIRQAIIERDSGVCAYCGVVHPRPDVDHIIPRALGGTNTFDNLTTACPSCNRSKGAKTLNEWLS